MPVEVTGGASTTSRRPERMLTDLKAVGAGGNKVLLQDGRAYVDWQMGLAGPIFGYWNVEFPYIRSRRYVFRFILWLLRRRKCRLPLWIASIAHRDEQIVANMLGQFYPDIESVRWMVNGSDACAAAVKLARAVTERDKILVYGYHGTASAYCTPPDGNARPGLPTQDMRRGTLAAEREAFVPLDWCQTNMKLDNLEWGEIAAVVVECPPDDTGKEYATAWLYKLIEYVDNSGALFILDEIVTGFRYGLQGASGYYGLEGLVDLYCFGKTIGNGFPIAALAGRKEIMDELTNGVHFSGTFFGYPLGLAAAKATLRQLLDEPPWDHLYDVGRYLKEQWNDSVLPYKLVGHPTRPIINPDTVDERFTDLRRHLFRRGHIVVDHPWYVTTATTKEDVDDLVEKANGWEH